MLKFKGAFLLVLKQYAPIALLRGFKLAVKIISVEENSIAFALGILSGDVLLSVNGHEITDVLDYRFFETEKNLKIEILRNNEKLVFNIKKTVYSAVGLEFESYLMDKEKSCKNKCVFCFIDQLPKGMRETLYFKDDDERLSFLFGNYVTLTNMDEKEIQRIIDMRISPINVSVHTMNEALRCEMMHNRFAGEKLKYLKMLTEGGININAQLVLCPSINDGKELAYSLEKLSEYGENLQSLACVPVGLTAHRKGLYKLRAYTKEEAREVIETIEKFGDENLRKYGERRFYPSDEFYIIAEKELPCYDWYEDFPQIENGVGMFRNLEEELLFALEEAEEKVNGRSVTIITGKAIFPLMNTLLDEVSKKWDNVKIDLVAIENEFFGGSVDVTGLLTGGDIIKQLNGKDLHEELLIPDVTLKADMDIFLDDVKLEEIGEKLNVKTSKFGSSGQNLLDAILGEL